MKSISIVPTVLTISIFSLVSAAAENLTPPKNVVAGEAFSISSTGTGKATLYIFGPGQGLKRDIQLGDAIYFPNGSLCHAGHYVITVSAGTLTENHEFDVVPASQPTDISFLARPSRLAVGVPNGISGTSYIFDAYHNLITTPTTVTFQLVDPSGSAQTHTAVTRNGVAWTLMDSSPKQGSDRFTARTGELSSTRIIGQVPGDPCDLKMSAQRVGKQIHLTTEPVRDCSGNAVPDGTILTFTETYRGSESTADVPLKKGIAEIQMPDYPGATLSVASGVVLGNQIRWGR